MKKSRFDFADFLKGIAVILMIQIHLTELFAQSIFSNGLMGKISLFLGGVPAAPVFMLVMGYFIAYSGRSTISKIKRGFYLVTGGLFLNLGLNTHLFFKIHQGTSSLNPIPFILGVDILPLAGLSIIIIAIAEHILKKHLIFPFAAAFIVFLASSLLFIEPNMTSPIKYLYAFFAGKFTWSYFPLLPWLAYPLLGYGIYHVHQQMKPDSVVFRFLPLLTLISSIGALLLIPLIGHISWDLRSYYHHGWKFGLWACLFMTAWISTFYLIHQKISISSLGKFLSWTGKNVTAFYVFQWLIIGNIATAIYKTQTESQLIIWFLLIVPAVSIFTLLWREIKNTF